MSMSIKKELGFIQEEKNLSKEISEKIEEMKALYQREGLEYASPLSHGVGKEFIESSSTFFFEVGLMLDGAIESKKRLIKQWEETIGAEHE